MQMKSDFSRLTIESSPQIKNQNLQNKNSFLGFKNQYFDSFV